MSLSEKFKKLKRAMLHKGESLSAEELENYEASKSDRKMEEVTDEVIGSFARPSHVTVFKILLAVLLASSIVIFSVSFMRYTELQKRREALEDKVAELEMEIDELQYLIGVPKDDYEYMVRIAREKLGLYYPDETIYYNGTNK